MEPTRNSHQCRQGVFQMAGKSETNLVLLSQLMNYDSEYYLFFVQLMNYYSEYYLFFVQLMNYDSEYYLL